MLGIFVLVVDLGCKFGTNISRIPRVHFCVLSLPILMVCTRRQSMWELKLANLHCSAPCAEMRRHALVRIDCKHPTVGSIGCCFLASQQARVVQPRSCPRFWWPDWLVTILAQWLVQCLVQWQMSVLMRCSALVGALFGSNLLAQWFVHWFRFIFVYAPLVYASQIWDVFGALG